jgi:predicted nucleic acid-binding protein
MASPEHFALDTNIYDKIADVPGALDLVNRLIAAGKVRLFVTHIQEDELADAPASRRKVLGVVPRDVVPTYGFVLDHSRLDMARLGEAEPIEAVRGENWEKRTRDALIAVTAGHEGHTLVTEDADLRTRAGAGLGVTVWDWATFYGHLTELDA